MKRTVILSHGLESGPDASKVSAMAAAAEALGWLTLRPDYRDLDAAHGLAGAQLRLQRLLEVARATPGHVVLAGSSFGAFISGLASLEIEVRGLFLLALPLQLPGFARAFDSAMVPTCVLHGWHDELIPAQAVFGYCAGRSIELQLVDDSHRLSNHVESSGARFGAFLRGLALP
jgi:predicted alpha/beta-hydrolase family hydrolase